MNIDKYKNEGWGISKKGFISSEKILKILNETNKNLTILEFGSGLSTSFFIDFLLE